MSEGQPIKVPKHIRLLGRQFRIFILPAEMVLEQRQAFAAKARELGLHDTLLDPVADSPELAKVIHERISRMDAFPELIARSILEVGTTWNEPDAKILEAELRKVSAEVEPNMELVRRYVAITVLGIGAFRTPFGVRGPIEELPPGYEESE